MSSLNYKEHIKLSWANAEKDTSKVNQEILGMSGMSGRRTRHFINNLCAMPDCKYLEVGTWKGSTLCSAMFANKINCTCIDDWSQSFSSASDVGPKEVFLKNFKKFKGINNAIFIEKNCWEIDPEHIGKFNIYFYDGSHSHEAQHRALTHFLPSLDDEFIFMVDDWNLERVQWGTNKGIEENSLNVLYKKEILTTEDGSHPPPKKSGPNSDWHNGLCVFVLKKKKKK